MKPVPSVFILIASVLQFFPIAAHAWTRPTYFSKPLPPLTRFVNPQKKTVCSITINSSDEKESFKQHLDPKDFNFVEFVRPKDATQGEGNSSDSWFQNACKSGIKCDVLLISGHFGGTFFGSSGQRLSLDELEGASCRNDCSGILSHPKEVFLFGCNTLAGKEKDHRTQAEYVEVLVADHYERHDAERIAEARYGAFGAENKDRMKRTFSGVPYLYGFKSVGPSGKTVKPLLDTYFARVGDYSAHLDAIEKPANAETQPNQALSGALVQSAFTQCRGIDPSEPAYREKSQICALYNKAMPQTERLRIVSDLLNSDRVLAFLPVLQGLLFPQGVNSRSAGDAELLQLVRSNENVKALLLRSLHAIQTPMLKYDWMRFALSLEWVSKEEFLSQYYLMIDTLLQPPVSQGSADAICSLRLPDGMRLDAERFSSYIDMDRRSYGPIDHALLCLGTLRVRKRTEATLRLLRAMRVEDREGTAFSLSQVSGYLMFKDAFPVAVSPETEKLESVMVNEAVRICDARINSRNEESCIEIFEKGAPGSREAFDWAESEIAQEKKDHADSVHWILNSNSRVSSRYQEQIIREYLSSFPSTEASAYFQTHPLKDTKLKAKLLEVLKKCAFQCKPSDLREENIANAIWAFKGDSVYSKPVSVLAVQFWKMASDGPGAGQFLAGSILQGCMAAPAAFTDFERRKLISVWNLEFDSDLHSMMEQLEVCGWGNEIRASRELSTDLLTKIGSFDFARSGLTHFRNPYKPNSKVMREFSIWQFLRGTNRQAQNHYRELLTECAEKRLPVCEHPLFDGLYQSAVSELRANAP